ncbi:MAG: hypothetical protein ACKO7P_08525 [Bacteroidota bacterium]
MRLVKQIPHERYLIQLHQYNGKFILKIELSGFEQVFKVSELDADIEKLENKLSEEFLKNCFDRFLSMRSDWENLTSTL